MPTSMYCIGDAITVSLRGMDLEEFTIEGEVEEVSDNPPVKCSAVLPPDRFWYRLKGLPNFFRESTLKRRSVKEEDSLCMAT